MKVLLPTMLGTAVLCGCAASPAPPTTTADAAGEVIELPGADPELGPRRFGLDCGVLLRDDFSLFHEGECARQLEGDPEPDSGPRELVIKELPDGG